MGCRGFQVGGPGLCVRDRVAKREEPPPPADFSPPQDSLGLLDNFTGDLESLTSLCIWKWGCWGQHQTSFGASVYILLGLY